MFCFETPPVDTFKIVFDVRVSRFGNIDLVRIAGLFHPGGDIDRFAPNIVSDFAAANHSGYHRTGVNADPQVEGVAELRQCFFALTVGKAPDFQGCCQDLSHIN